MHNFSIAFACVIAVSACQPCLAGTAHGDRYDLARRSTTVEQFKRDRDECTAKVIMASRRHSSRADHKRSCQGGPGIPNGLPPNPGLANPGPVDNHPMSNSSYQGPYQGESKYSRADKLFLQCMREKGYWRVPESTGFGVGPLWR
jgi:hypothetical protein